MKCLKLLLCIASAIAPLSCGKPHFDEPPVDPQDQIIPVTGNAAFGTQCPYGFVSPAQTFDLGLQNCPIPIGQVDLIEPLQPIFLEADCVKKTLTLRSGDRKLDSSWEAYPDGSFYFEFDMPPAQVRTDGVGTLNCFSPMVAEVSGKLTCKDRDKVNIHIETQWNLGKTLDSSINQAYSPLCKFPKGCFFYTSANISQCQ